MEPHQNDPVDGVQVAQVSPLGNAHSIGPTSTVAGNLVPTPAGFQKFQDKHAGKSVTFVSTTKGLFAFL